MQAVKRGYKRSYPFGDNRPSAKRFKASYVPRNWTSAEWKYSDVLVNHDVNTATALTLLNGLVPGTGATQRIGQKIVIKSIEIRVRVQVDPNGGVRQLVRWMVVMDRQANGAAPTLAQILNVNTPYGLRNLENRKRFKIILDNVKYLAPLNQEGDGCYYHVYFKFRKPLIVEYNAGNAGTVADIVSNSLYMFSVGDQAAGNGDAVLASYCRLRYTDL